MKPFSSVLILNIVCIFLCSCSLTSSLIGDEKKVDSARGWNLLANQVAHRMNEELVRQEMFSTRIYVHNSCGAPKKCKPSDTFAFDEGFHDLVVHQLVNFGVVTVSSPKTADLIMEYKVQTVFHPPRDATWYWFGKDGYYEVLVSAQIEKNEKYFFLFSDIFSIPLREFWQYTPLTAPPEVKLTDAEGMASPEPPAKQSISL
ncbi:hypothetical protein JWJ90_06645 [Desulfobulbus rhabdoformis]|jgi:hypothetical protein|uniref:hypothetical protein n=1 Tax=Desulfobulbus rhabdoformis TaxID=34032 RepID=UPI001962F05C|nr:hypothetical protein [Desulfobulbus rhabdoformis]MBM9613968.1 hypothetical protein [Desulfobulbus rhabdoformis]